MPSTVPLIVTCDQAPVPPLNGSNKKVHDVLMALRGGAPIHAIVYPASPDEARTLDEYWSGGVQFHCLARKSFAAPVRSLLTGHSIPTVTRDFEAEAAVLRGIVRREPQSRLLIDFISGAPLVRQVMSGAVISGHDCMSHLFREEADRATTLKTRARFLVRERLARRAESRYYPQADAVHVVSAKDAAELSRVDVNIRATVIPIAAYLPPSEQLAPPGTRTQRVIWGNLGSPVILAGVRQLVDAARPHTGSLRGWTLIGRVGANEAHRLVPELRGLGIEYLASAHNLATILGQAAVVLLPDVGGTGQKNRTLDALAHGACVVGLAEVFRGIEPRGQFVEVAGFEDALAFLAGHAASDMAAIGARARAFAGTLDLHQRGEQWRALLGSVPPLALTA
jgi:hypothetical protein